MTTGFAFTLGLFLGLAVMGAIWAVLTNMRNHPGKLKEQLEESVEKAKARMGEHP